MADKTNVMRILEAADISYRAAEYPWSEDDLSAQHAAAVLGIPSERMFKTLVAVGSDGGVRIFCIPVSNELNLKKAAKAAGVKAIEMLHLQQLLPTTGYLRGGCSPIGMKKAYPTWIDETAELWEEISISAGRRGCQVIVRPDALITLIGARTADLTE